MKQSERELKQSKFRINEPWKMQKLPSKKINLIAEKEDSSE